MVLENAGVDVAVIGEGAAIREPIEVDVEAEVVLIAGGFVRMRVAAEAMDEETEAVLLAAADAGKPRLVIHAVAFAGDVVFAGEHLEGGEAADGGRGGKRAVIEVGLHGLVDCGQDGLALGKGEPEIVRAEFFIGRS